MGMSIVKNPAIHMDYIRPVRGRPLVLNVHTSIRSDVAQVARNGVVKTVQALSRRCNFLELVNARKYRADASYSGLDGCNMVKDPYNGFFFDKPSIPWIKQYLDGTQDIIFTGGLATKCLRASLFSVLALKTFGASDAVVELFKDDGVEYRRAMNMLKEGGAPVENEEMLRLHLNKEAIYVSMQDIFPRVIGGKNNIADEQKELMGDYLFFKASKTYKSVQEITQKTREVLCSLPKYHKEKLENSGLNIYQCLGKDLGAERISEGKDGSVSVVLYYWTNTEEMLDFFRKKIIPDL